MEENPFRPRENQSPPAPSRYGAVLFATFVGTAVGFMDECWDQYQTYSFFGVEWSAEHWQELVVMSVENIVTCGVFGRVAGLLGLPFLNRRKSAHA